MLYIVDINYDSESDHWYSTGDNIRGLVMGAGSVDLLMERTNLAISDLTESTQFEVEYRFNHRVKINYG